MSTGVSAHLFTLTRAGFFVSFPCVSRRNCGPLESPRQRFSGPSSAAPGVWPYFAAAQGNTLDIELNVTFPGAPDSRVPERFGEVGVRVLASNSSFSDMYE